MTRSNLYVHWGWSDKNQNREIEFYDGTVWVTTPNEGFGIKLTYSSALNLASKLLQWATNLPESEKGNIHKIDGEWVDIDNPPQH